MTCAPALIEGAWISDADPDAIAEIASVWSVLETMEDYPATPARRRALDLHRAVFRQRLAAAGLTEADLRAHLQRQAAEPRTRLRAVGGAPPDG